LYLDPSGITKLKCENDWFLGESLISEESVFFWFLI